ncbi:MAG: hypothetical protein V7K98_19045 [Nostoc sp.]
MSVLKSAITEDGASPIAIFVETVLKVMRSFFGMGCGVRSLLMVDERVMSFRPSAIILI